MYKVGLIGDAPEYVDNKEHLKRQIHQMLDLLQFQYKNLVINLAGETGSAEWATDSCIELGLKYHIFSSFRPEDYNMLWFDWQVQKLKIHLDSAWATSIVGKYDPKTASATKAENYRRVVDNSQFIVFFWNGRKQGDVVDAIRYALERNVLCIDAINNHSMITKKNI